MYKNIIKIALQLSLIGVGLLILGYLIGWGIYSYVMADFKPETSIYPSNELKVNDGAYNGLQTANYPLQPNINMIQPDMGYTFTGKVYE